MNREAPREPLPVVWGVLNTGHIITIGTTLIGLIISGAILWGAMTTRLAALEESIKTKPSADSFKALVDRVERLERADYERVKDRDEFRGELAKISAGQQIQTVLLQNLATQIGDLKENSKRSLRP